ncbi:MAG: peptidoglycan-binding domain-containing protein [Pseudomonadota bacterium]
MVREETVEFQIVPAEFETVSEEILVEPERVEQRSIPAQYETYTETVTITPERVAWKPGRGLYGRTASTTPPSRRDALSPTATGEVLCRVIVPAVTETVQRTRMVTPPRVEDTVIPAVYETVTRRVEVRPARVEEILVPAEFRDVPTRILVTPEQDRRTVEPAVYKTVSRQEVVGGGDVIWAEVLCETNTTRYKVAEIQGALTDAGYPTRVDGVFGPDTLRSMQAFQQDRGLSEGYLTIDTVEALGINPYARPPDLVYALLRSPTRA